MKLQKLAGATSEIWQIFVRDSSSTTGAGLAGLTNASGGLTAYYHRNTDTTATVINLVTMTVGAFTSSGFKEIDATNMPGWYQFCPPNAAVAAGAKSCAIHLKGATNMAPLPIEVQLTAVNPDSATAFMTGVNSLAPPTNWNLVSIDANGRLDIININGTAQTARDIGASVLLSSGAGAGQLDFASGVVKANATQWLGGIIPAVNVTGVPLVDLKYALGTLSPAAAGSVGIDWAQVANKTATVVLTNTTVASVSGAVGSVTGAVGSVTGNVGGSVASVVGAVGSVTGNVGGSVASVVGAVGSVAGGVVGNLGGSVLGDVVGHLGGSVLGSVVGSVASVVGAVGSVAGDVGGNVIGSVGSIIGVTVKKNVALAAFPFTMTDSTNHVPTPGLSVSAARSLDGGVFAACANAVTELGSGDYKISLAATDLNANTVMLRFTASAADDLNICVVTQP